MYADMMRKQQQKDMESKRKQDKIASYLAADLENKKDNDQTPEEMERIRKRQAGHPVTLESFNAWKEKFDHEMSLLKSNTNAVKLEVAIDESRPTGKQLFMTNKASEDLENALIEEGEKEEITEEDEQLLLKKLNDKINNTSSSNNTKTTAAGISIEDVDLEDDDDDEDYIDEGEEDDDDDDYEDENES